MMLLKGFVLLVAGAMVAWGAVSLYYCFAPVIEAMLSALVF